MAYRTIEIKIDYEQYEAFRILKKHNFNRNALIRIAIDNYLYSEYRTLLNKERKEQVRRDLEKQHPEWAI